MGLMGKQHRYRPGESRMIRVIDGALIDEQGERLDRDHSFDEANLETALLESADRLVQLDGRRAPRDISRGEFERLLASLSDDDQPWILRYANGQRSIIGIDVSDCPNAT